jgi:hypothetical protein
MGGIAIQIEPVRIEVSGVVNANPFGAITKVPGVCFI